MNVILMAHTQLNMNFAIDYLPLDISFESHDAQHVALTAIRTCYSHLKPKDILNVEGQKYLMKDDKADFDRLFLHIVRSGHLSTLEHITFTFCIEGITRACLAQLTRHRVGFSYSVQSQRYVKLSSTDKAGGFSYAVPEKIGQSASERERYERMMEQLQVCYDELREAGIPAEDARMVLPNAATTNLVMTCNLRALLDFYEKRKPGSGAQQEISRLALLLKEQVLEIEPWLEPYFHEKKE